MANSGGPGSFMRARDYEALRKSKKEMTRGSAHREGAAAAWQIPVWRGGFDRRQ
jgi:hypothetical protein